MRAWRPGGGIQQLAAKGRTIPSATNNADSVDSSHVAALSTSPLNMSTAASTMAYWLLHSEGHTSVSVWSRDVLPLYSLLPEWQECINLCSTGGVPRKDLGLYYCVRTWQHNLCFLSSCLLFDAHVCQLGNPISVA